MSRFRLLHHLPHLLRRAHFESDALFAQVYGDAVTSRQLALLVAVRQRPGASQSQVAQDIGLDLNTCSDLVLRTVRKGLLRRERSAADARSFSLLLTDEGSQLLEDTTTKATEYQNAVAARLNKAEREQLVALLRKLLGFDG
ncbi:MarR family transcriptional regulator [Variovorax sp. J22R24]|uniref:MarR family winged helix-turn-helix transcriptional regulator n=1 Tax=Variovorax gracilis TaxID=3053502 RepID=UPI002578D016|nr:MarR family transcriptional regulator [Variovorax sp. J22R24]MDM0107974.1 MarR family transcriptional regulator [Variovorax sp. J22R24]